MAIRERPDGVGSRCRDGGGFGVEIDEGRIEVTALEAGTLRVRARRHGEPSPPRSWSPFTPPERFDMPSTRLLDAPGCVGLETDLLRATIDRAAGHFTIRGDDGRVLVADAAEGPGRSLGDTQASWRLMAPAGRDFYGLGERTGPLEKRGRRHTCWTTDEWRLQDDATDALYVSIPFYLALDEDGAAHGILLGSTYRTVIDIASRDPDVVELEYAEPEASWYFLAGPTAVDVLRRLADLTGGIGLPPRWALGYHQARWGYASAARIEDVATQLRRHRVPADAIHLDIDHMYGYRVFTWDPDRFPDPAGLIAALGEQGFRATVVVDAAVKYQPDGGYAVYADGAAAGHFIGQVGDPDRPPYLGWVWPGLAAFPDHTRPAVRTWWGCRYATHLEVGVAGFLNDMNEPAMHERPIDEPGSPNAEPPPDLAMGPADEPTTHAEVRNLYASLENRGTHEALERLEPDRRPFVVTRSGFAGLQRHAVLWTGDNSSTWEHLRMSIPQLLNLGISGVPLAGADIGGFFGDCSAELLARWYQLGAFYPFCRNNSARDSRPQEPYALGDEPLEASRAALELRYRLLPYLVTVVEEAARTGVPVLRPLYLHDGTDPRLRRVEDAALLGPDLLVAPQLDPGRTSRTVYLPRGDWYELGRPNRHRGGRTLTVLTPLRGPAPVLVRAGSIIPFGPPMQSTSERQLDELRLEIYPDAAGAAVGRLYEDDGETTRYRDGERCVTTYRAEPRPGRRWHVTSTRHGRFRPPARSLEVVLPEPSRTLRRSISDGPRWSILLTDEAPTA